MATISDNDDLLILSDDDNNNEKLVMEENSFNEDLELSNEELLTFDGLDLPETNKSEETLEKNDFSVNSEDDLDLFSSSDSKTTDSSEIKEEKNDFDLLDLNEETKDVEIEKKEEVIFNTPTLVSNNVSVWTMEDILNRAMSELDLRSETIANEKNIEESNISNLEEQIKILEESVRVANEKVEALNTELAMIAKNEKAIEKMKESNMVVETKTETLSKTSNSKRK